MKALYTASGSACAPSPLRKTDSPREEAIPNRSAGRQTAVCAPPNVPHSREHGPATGSPHPALPDSPEPTAEKDHRRIFDKTEFQKRLTGRRRILQILILNLTRL